MKGIKQFTSRMLAVMLAGTLAVGSVSVSAFGAEDAGSTVAAAEKFSLEEATENSAAEATATEEADREVMTESSSAEVVDGEGVSESPDAAFADTSQIAAEEDAVTSYTVTLDANGGYFSNEWDDVLNETLEKTEVLNKIVPVGGMVSVAPVKEQEGNVATFLGWSLERDGEILPQEQEGYAPVGDCVLFAVWKYNDINDETTVYDDVTGSLTNEDKLTTEDEFTTEDDYSDDIKDIAEEESTDTIGGVSESAESFPMQSDEPNVTTEESVSPSIDLKDEAYETQSSTTENVAHSTPIDEYDPLSTSTTKVDTKLGWKCKSEFLVNNAGIWLGHLNQHYIRDFYKQNDGYAIAVFRNLNSEDPWVGPVLISTVPEYVSYRVTGDDARDNIGYNGTYDYLGMTWYINAAWHVRNTTFTSPFTVVDDMSNMKEIFDLAGVEFYGIDLSNATLTLPSDLTCVYNGSKHEPNVTVTLYGKILEKDIDYTISYSDNVNAGNAKITVTGKGKYTGTATSSFVITEAPSLDYLEVGFNGKVTVHWIYKGESDAISGFEVQHRWEGSDGIRTTKVSGSDKREVDIVDLSYNIYEFRIRAVSSKQEEAESDTGWSEWAKCPVKEIKFERLEPGSSNVDSFSFEGIINFGTNICIHENHKAAVYEKGKSESPVISLPFELSDNYTDNLTLETMPHTFSYNSVYSINPSEITKLDAGKNYHIAIDEKAIEYVDDNYDRYNEDIPIYFAGIDKSDSSTWSFSTIHLSYPGLENPGKFSNHLIPEKYYKLLFGPEDYKDIQERDNGSGGICFGLCYTVGAYQDGLPYINKIVSDNLMLPDISAHTGEMRLSDVPIGEGSKLIEYIRMAHLFQYRSEYITIKKDKEKINNLYKAIKAGKNVIISVKKQEKKNEGHVVYSPGILSGGGSSPINIPVYDPAAGSYRSFIKTVTLSSDAKKMERYGEYDSFNWYYEIIPEVDEKIEEYINSWDYNKLSYGEYTFITSTKELEEQDNLTPLFSENGDSNNEGLYCYWLEGNSYHIDDVTEETTITISDGKNKIYTSLSSGQSADLDIDNNTVQIDENSEGAYQIRFSYASNYEDFSDIIVSGKLRTEGAFISKTDDGLKVETEDNAEIEVKTEDNKEETDSMMLILPSGGAEIRTEEDELRAYSDEDGNGIFSERIVLPLDFSKVSINGLSSKFYTGSAIVQIPVVKLGSITLKEKKDYTVSYANNTNAGTATVTITGKGNYTGTVSKTFKINSASISNAAVTGINNKTYTGSALTQNFTVKVGDQTLAKDTDYTVSYANNTNVGTATVTITGKGNYSAKKTLTFKINKAAQSITAKAAASRIAAGKTTTVSITGNKGTKSFKSSNTGIATVDSKTGKVTAKKVGTVKITATSAATANYNATSKTVTIKVVPAATASLTATNQATGIKLTWKKVTGANGYKVYRGSTLIKTITNGSTVTFADTKANTNGTKYTYKVIAKAATGDSTLSKSVAVYRVSRPAVSTVTNSATSKMTVKWGKNAKATGYQIQYSTDKTFKTGNKAVTVAGASAVSKVIGSLTKNKTYYVRIRTYKTVGSAKYWSVWSAAKSVKIAK